MNAAMRSRPPFIPLTLIVLLAVGPAFGATYGKPKKRFRPPPIAATDGLRGPISAPALLPPPLLTSPAPGRPLAGLSASALAPPPAISPLRTVGDPAPICRAECAKVRLVCAATDDLGCDSHWIQCVADCSAPILQ